ncbi:MAG TPA: hypothetical protein VFO76_04395 [Candidatus Kapabacteria bacterium]|nr:hypothetical protein [Candidatus Kapabacteria bacterium]
MKSISCTTFFCLQLLGAGMGFCDDVVTLRTGYQYRGTIIAGKTDTSITMLISGSAVDKVIPVDSIYSISSSGIATTSNSSGTNQYIILNDSSFYYGEIVQQYSSENALQTYSKPDYLPGSFIRKPPPTDTVGLTLKNNWKIDGYLLEERPDGRITMRVFPSILVLDASKPNSYRIIREEQIARVSDDHPSIPNTNFAKAIDAPRDTTSPRQIVDKKRKGLGGTIFASNKYVGLGSGINLGKGWGMNINFMSNNPDIVLALLGGQPSGGSGPAIEYDNIEAGVSIPLSEDWALFSNIGVSLQSPRTFFTISSGFEWFFSDKMYLLAGASSEPFCARIGIGFCDITTFIGSLSSDNK